MRQILVLALVLFWQSPGMTNQDVVELVKLGLSPDIVHAKVSKSGCNFDTSPKALAELKGAGVPDSIVVAMISAPCEIEKPRGAEPSKGVSALYEVQRIYIGDMGKSDDAERFRLLLTKKLSEHFTIVGKPEEADGILKGAVATQLSKGTTQARASASLSSTDGRQLWRDDFGVRFAWSRDDIKLRAEDVANGLFSAWKKSAKTKAEVGPK